MRLLPWAVLFLCSAASHPLRAQLSSGTPADALRVTVSQNADGSRTTYESDPVNKKATATTTTAAGKPAGTIKYQLDEAGRYARGEAYGVDGKLQFKTQYKYDQTGRLAEELRLNKEEALQMKLVYAYDSAGKPAGYAVYDGEGKLLGKTQPAAGAAAKKAR